MPIYGHKVAWSSLYVNERMGGRSWEQESGFQGWTFMPIMSCRAACLSVPMWDPESLLPPWFEPPSSQFPGCVSGRWTGASPRFCPLKLIDFCADFYSTNVIVR